MDTLLATRDGGLWVGYQRWGATFIAADGRVTNYSVEQGLPVGSIRSVAEDHDGVVWVAATGGLARLEAGRWRTVRMDWNYPCRSAWKLIVQDEGTGAAIAGRSFRSCPSAIASTGPLPRRTSTRGGLSLPALTRTLRIDYTALSLTIPERVKFRYRLEGWETAWHDAGTRRTAVYTDPDAINIAATSAWHQMV